MRKVISILLVLTVICGTLVFATVSANAENSADSIVAIAEGELGNTNYRKYSSYANAWCADFVSWCARQAGVDSIPSTASCYSMYNGMIANGCQEVSSPQRGDIVFFFCDSCSGTANIWCHVGIMVNSSTSIDGNYSGKVSYDNSYSHYGSLGYKHSSGIRKIYVRPNYGNPNFPGEEDTSWNVPVWKSANCDLNTYNSSGIQESGRWISAGDNCYVEHVYTNGYAWVCYPIDGGGERWAYTLASGFSLEKKKINGHVMSESEGAGKTIPDGDYWIISKIDENYFIDIPGNDFNTNNKKNVQTWIWESGLPPIYDVFHFVYLNNGYYKITQLNTNMALDVYEANLERGANVSMWEDIGTESQQWSIERSNGGYKLRSRCNNFYLDIYDEKFESGTNVLTWEWSENKNQYFSFIPYHPNEKPVANGLYKIGSALNGCYLDVYGSPGEFAEKSNIQIYNQPDDTFQVEYVGNGYYQISEATSHLMMEIINDGELSFLNNNRNTILFGKNNRKNQLWKIRENNDGTFFLINQLSGYYLDIEGSNTANGTNISQYQYNGNNNQRWKLFRSLLDDMITVSDITVKSDTDEIIPEITVTVDGTIIPQEGNYKVEITSDVKAGKGTVTVTGIDKYCDSVTKEFNITKDQTILGDADGDGDITSVDAAMVMRANVELDTGIDKDILMNGDVDGNGALEIIDATFIQRYLALMDTPYPIGNAKI